MIDCLDVKKQTFITDVMFWNDWSSVNPFANVNWRDFYIYRNLL